MLDSLVREKVETVVRMDLGNMENYEYVRLPAPARAAIYDGSRLKVVYDDQVLVFEPGLCTPASVASTIAFARLGEYTLLLGILKGGCVRLSVTRSDDGCLETTFSSK